MARRCKAAPDDQYWTFKKNPGLLDRLAIRFLRSSIGEVPHDPELDHPEN